MPIRLVAFDLDGTLIRGRNSLAVLGAALCHPEWEQQMEILYMRGEAPEEMGTNELRLTLHLPLSPQVSPTTMAIRVAASRPAHGRTAIPIASRIMVHLQCGLPNCASARSRGWRRASGQCDGRVDYDLYLRSRPRSSTRFGVQSSQMSGSGRPS